MKWHKKKTVMLRIKIIECCFVLRRRERTQACQVPWFLDNQWIGVLYRTTWSSCETASSDYKSLKIKKSPQSSFIDSQIVSQHTQWNHSIFNYLKKMYIPRSWNVNLKSFKCCAFLSLIFFLFFYTVAIIIKVLYLILLFVYIL